MAKNPTPEDFWKFYQCAAQDHPCHNNRCWRVIANCSASVPILEKNEDWPDFNPNTRSIFGLNPEEIRRRTIEMAYKYDVALGMKTDAFFMEKLNERRE